MKQIHANKLGAVMEMKFRALFSKNFIIMPIFSIGMAVILKIVYGQIMPDVGLTSELRGLALSLGAEMNVSMSGIYCVSAAMAEEKEKHTLRVLMTSSVNGMEFFLGSIIPVILMVTVINVILVPLMGVSMDAASWGVYLGISVLCAFAGAVIGMVFGIFSKDQVTAGTITTPALMVMLMIPVFAQFNQTVEKVSGFLFTGVMKQMIDNLAVSGKAFVDGKGVLVVAAEAVLSLAVFLIIYQKNGYESD